MRIPLLRRFPSVFSDLPSPASTGASSPGMSTKPLCLRDETVVTRVRYLRVRLQGGQTCNLSLISFGRSRAGQRERERCGLRERAVGPTRTAVAAVPQWDSGRTTICGAVWSTLEAGAPVLADCAVAF